MRQEEALTRVSSKSRSKFDFSGSWKNELKSTMEFVQVESVLKGV